MITIRMALAASAPASAPPSALSASARTDFSSLVCAGAAPCATQFNYLSVTTGASALPPPRSPSSPRAAEAWGTRIWRRRRRRRRRRGGGVALRSGGVREKRILGGGKARERERGERALHSDRRGKGKKRKKRRHENGGREGGGGKGIRSLAADNPRRKQVQESSSLSGVSPIGVTTVGRREEVKPSKV